MQNIFDGQMLALLGAAVAFFIAGLGSSKGVGLAGQAGCRSIIRGSLKIRISHAFGSAPQHTGHIRIRYRVLIIGKIDPAMTIQQGLISWQRTSIVSWDGFPLFTRARLLLQAFS
jgi:V/A-type H+-transporting ATPase subunit K